jgi:hypothetical protein
LEQGGRETNGISLQYQERFLDDKWDPEGVVAVFRGRDFGSYALQDNVNFFGENGGFDMVITRLANTAPLLPMPVYRKLLEALGRTANVLAKPWAQKALEKLEQAVFGRILAFSDNELRVLTKVRTVVRDPIIPNLSSRE